MEPNDAWLKSQSLKLISAISSHNLENVIVDPKKDSFNHYRGANIITPNLNELKKASNIDIKDDKSIVDACNQLIKENNFNYIVAKKGDKHARRCEEQTKRSVLGGG